MKTMRNAGPTWSPVFKLFHWSTALLILLMFVLGWVAVTYPMSPTKIELFNWHKSVGLFILAWTMIRLGWRATHARPPFPEISAIEQQVARVTHALLYLLIILMPLSGWIINSAADFPLKWFGLFQVPQLVAPDKDVQDAAETVHYILSWTILSVVLLHIAAAVRHHFYARNDVLLRMLPFVGGRK